MSPFRSASNTLNSFTLCSIEAPCVALVLALGLADVVTADPPLGVQVAGLVLALTGFAATLAAQTGMGASWRIGVDPDDRTDLVTGGVFAHVRNPIFTAMVAAQAGVVLMVPTWISVLALLALVAAVQLQVRAVEEPYLRAVHGADYAAYAARAGRFVPGIGRLPAPASADRTPA